MAPEGRHSSELSFLLSLIHLRLGGNVFSNPETPTGADRPTWPQRKPALCSQRTRKEQPLKTENSSAEAALLQANALEKTSSIPPVPEGTNEGPGFHLRQAVMRHPKPARVGQGSRVGSPTLGAGLGLMPGGSLTSPASVSVEATWGAAGGHPPPPPSQGAVCVRTQSPHRGRHERVPALLHQRRPDGEPDFSPYPAVMRQCSSFCYQTKVRGRQQEKPARQEELIKSNVIT